MGWKIIALARLHIHGDVGQAYQHNMCRGDQNENMTEYTPVMSIECDLVLSSELGFMIITTLFLVCSNFTTRMK